MNDKLESEFTKKYRTKLYCMFVEILDKHERRFKHIY